MQVRGIPVVYHPTSVVLIDDDQSWLDLISVEIESVAPCMAFNQPKLGLDFILQQAAAGGARNKMNQLFSQSLDGVNLINLASDKQRFAELGVIVLDYQMPGMTGIEVAKKLQHLDVKKILLTGEADESMAVDLFNLGVIDAFVRKSTPSVSRVLAHTIQDLQCARFLEASQMLLGTLLFQQEQNLSDVLQNQQCSDYLRHLFERENIREWYLLSAPANFLLIDDNGRQSWLCIRDESEMQLQLAWAKQEQAQEPGIAEIDSIVNSLGSREKLVFFPGGDELSYFEWAPYIHPCKKIVTDAGHYYYSLIRRSDVYPTLAEQPLGLSQYLDEQVIT